MLFLAYSGKVISASEKITKLKHIYCIGKVINKYQMFTIF